MWSEESRQGEEEGKRTERETIVIEGLMTKPNVNDRAFHGLRVEGCTGFGRTRIFKAEVTSNGITHEEVKNSEGEGKEEQRDRITRLRSH